MRISSLTALAVVALSGLPRPVGAQDGNCEASDLDDYDYMFSPEDGFVIYWTVPAATVSMRVEASATEWLGVGFSEDGMMVGSDAVIFLPEEGDGDVGEHILGSKSRADILPSDHSELSDTDFEQDGETTTFSFTRNTTPVVADEDKLIIPNVEGHEIYLIWARGMDNTFGYHGEDNRGSFAVDLFCPGVSLTTAAPTTSSEVVPTPAATPTSSAIEPETPAPSAASRGGTFTLPPVSTLAPEPAAASPTTQPIPPPSPAPVAMEMTPSPVMAETTPAPIATSPAPAEVTEAPLAAVDTPAPVQTTPAPVETPLMTTAPVDTTPSPVVTVEATEAPVAENTEGGEEGGHSGDTPAPVEGARGVDGEGTFAPTVDITGFVSGAERVAGDVGWTAMISSASAFVVGVLWAKAN